MRSLVSGQQPTDEDFPLLSYEADHFAQMTERSTRFSALVAGGRSIFLVLWRILPRY